MKVLRLSARQNDSDFYSHINLTKNIYFLSEFNNFSNTKSNTCVLERLTSRKSEKNQYKTYHHEICMKV